MSDFKEYIALLNIHGTKTKAALAMGIPRKTFAYRLSKAMQGVEPLKINETPGWLEAFKPVVADLPTIGRKKIYLITSAQSATLLHDKGWDNLLAYAHFLSNIDGVDSEVMVGTYTYNKAAFGTDSVKRGSSNEKESIWYDPRIMSYIVDHSVKLAPGLIWCGEQNIMPSASRPTSRFEKYNGKHSNIIPHAKFELTSVATMAEKATKFNYTTGTVTQRNYIQKKDGILAEQSHCYGFLVVEVNSEGNWYIRQVSIAEDGSFYDIAPPPYNTIKCSNGEITEAKTESIYWFDLHASEIDPEIKELCWGEGGVLDTLTPNSQFVGDVFSMRSRNHHDVKDFHTSYVKWLAGEDSVKEEIDITVGVLNFISRPWCKTVVVPSNHDDHFSRWLNESDFRKDFINAEYFCYMQYHLLRSKREQRENFNILEFALKDAGASEELEFPGINTSYPVCGIENIIHGHLGPNGSRGTARNLSTLSRPLNKGHSHVVEIVDQVYSAGASRLTFPYMKGPHSHSIGFVVTYPNGARTTVVCYNGKWRA
jgi:hypothetical protein